MRSWHKIYPNLITQEALFESYREFRKDKNKSLDLLSFERNLEDNLFSLYERLKDKTYQPGGYTEFYITDPKVRLIHKAPIEDRVVHHLVSRVLEEIFDPLFIAHSYACRKGKGTHKGVKDLQRFARKVSKNGTKDCFALKCDIKKYFASINHRVLTELLSRRIKDEEFLDLLKKIIWSFPGDKNYGLPIGNLTSQFFANIYLNELDQFIKHVLKIKYYLRYTDDFIILSSQKNELRRLLPHIENFLKEKLLLELHPQKVRFVQFQNGIDFLGYVVFSHHIIPRTKTKKRMMLKIKIRVKEYQRGEVSYLNLKQTFQSYLGYLGHSNAYHLQHALKKIFRNQESKESNPKNLL